ncbi:hypothetical protein GCM10010402_74220 [Actinomadura luteofluorescens]
MNERGPVQNVIIGVQISVIIGLILGIAAAMGGATGVNATITGISAFFGSGGLTFSVMAAFGAFTRASSAEANDKTSKSEDGDTEAIRPIEDDRGTETV